MISETTYSKITEENVHQYIDVLSREDFDLYEYSSLSTDRLRAQLFANIRRTLSRESTVSLLQIHRGLIVGGIVMEFMEYDSSILQMKAYKIVSIHINSEVLMSYPSIVSLFLARIRESIEQNSIDYVVMSLNSNHSQSNILMNLFIQNDFLFIGSLISFKADQKDFQNIRYSCPESDGFAVRESNSSDEESIGLLAKNSYKLTRFHLDWRLDKSLCDELYSMSVINAINHEYADIALVADYSGVPVGYYTAKKVYYSELDITFGYGLLTAVDPDMRGKGVYKMLNDEILHWYRDHTDIAEMGCYLSNVPIHRTFTGNGLPIVRGSFQLAYYRNMAGSIEYSQ